MRSIACFGLIFTENRLQRAIREQLYFKVAQYIQENISTFEWPPSCYCLLSVSAHCPSESTGCSSSQLEDGSLWLNLLMVVMKYVNREIIILSSYKIIILSSSRSSYIMMLTEHYYLIMVRQAELPGTAIKNKNRNALHNLYT